MKIELFYDKECFFCNSYTNYLKLKEKYELKLVNVREYKSQINDFRSQGFDINDGFIIRIDEKNIYQGADALVFLNDLSHNRIYFPDNYYFRNIVYPIIKQFRKLFLFITNKKIDL